MNAYTVRAESKVVKIEGANFNIDWSLSENLKTFHNKVVTVHLNSGNEISGTVKAIGNNFVHIEKLIGKEYYDALIDISDVSAVSTPFREYKR